MSELERTFRFDAEFFNRTFLDAATRLKTVHTELLNRVVGISDGNHFTISDDFQDEGIPYYRGQDVTGHFFIEQAQPVCIPPKAFAMKHMTRSHLCKGDVLLSIVGTIGELSLVSSETEATCSCKLAILRPKTIKPGYLAVFLKSRYGQDQIHRLKRGAVQMGLLLEDMDQISIARFSQDFEDAVEKAVQDAKAKLDHCDHLNLQAEQTLLRALRLDNWQPPESLTYERKASEAFAAERLDAEYFHPSKQAALKILSTLSGKTVGEMFRSVRDLWQPETASSTVKVRNYDLTKALSPFLDDTNPPTLTDTIASTKKRIVKGDIVVSRLRSYLKEIAIVLDTGELPMVASTEFIVLRAKKHSMRIETLIVYLRSTLPQLVFKWSQDGSNHPRFDEKELLNLRVPDIILEHENEVAEKVQAAITSRQNARKLLDLAKRAVEIAIEESETVAIEYLKSPKGL